MAPVAEGGGQHADDLVRLAVDANRAADDVGVTPEAILPIPVADDEDAMVAQDLLVGTEAAAHSKSAAEDGEEIDGSADAEGHLRRPAGFGEAHFRAGVSGDLAVAVHLGLQIQVVGRRDAAEGILGSRAIDAVQSIAVGIGRRAHVSVEHAEHRRVGADAESERDDGDEGQAGRATQRLDGEPEVREDRDSRAHESPPRRVIRPPVHLPERSFMVFGSPAQTEEQEPRQGRTPGPIVLHGSALCQAWALHDASRLSRSRNPTVPEPTARRTARFQAALPYSKRAEWPFLFPETSPVGRGNRTWLGNVRLREA